MSFGDDVIERQQNATCVAHDGGSSRIIKKLCFNSECVLFGCFLFSIEIRALPLVADVVFHFVEFGIKIKPMTMPFIVYVRKIRFVLLVLE